MTLHPSLCKTVFIGVQLAVMATALPAFAAQEDREQHCQRVHGEFFSNVFAGPTCTSPVNICTDGTLTDSPLQSYDFTMLTLMPANDPSDPSLFLYTGASVIVTKRGSTVNGQDTGHLQFNPIAPSPFETSVNIDMPETPDCDEHAQGSGCHPGHAITGYLVATGAVSFISGTAQGTYEGEICHPHGWGPDR